MSLSYRLFVHVCVLLASIGVSHAASDTVSQAVQDECQRVGHKLGSVSVTRCLHSQLQDTGARSVNGQAILLKEYPPMLERRKPIGRVLLIGGTHGDEYAYKNIQPA